MQERKNANSQIIPYGVDIYASKDSIRAEYPGTLGYIIQTDMGQILSSDANYIKQIDNGNLKLSNVKLHYENWHLHESPSVRREQQEDGGLQRSDVLRGRQERR